MKTKIKILKKNAFSLTSTLSFPLFLAFLFFLTSAKFALTLSPNSNSQGNDFFNLENSRSSSVIVLIHGKTDKAEYKPEQRINTPGHPFNYWGFDFVCELLNQKETRLEVRKTITEKGMLFDKFMWESGGFTMQEYQNYYNLRASALGIYHFLNELTQGLLEQSIDKNIDLIDAIYDYVFENANGLVAKVLSFFGFDREGQAKRDIINEKKDELMRYLNQIQALEYTASNRLGSIVVSPEWQPPRVGPTIPNRSVMLTYRDGTKSLQDQSCDALSQISKLYRNNFGNLEINQQPHIIFMCHSMGGLVSRFLATNPDTWVTAGSSYLGGIASSTQAINMANNLLREQANFIRERTRYIITLATPHEGSPVADMATEIGAFFSNYIDSKKKIGGLICRGLHSYQSSTQDLRSSFWRNQNRTNLAPHKASRPDGTLIPIYAISGRTPSSGYFDNQARFTRTPNIANIGLQGLMDKLYKIDNIVYYLSFKTIEIDNPFAMDFKEVQDELHRIELPRERKEAFGLMLLDFGLHAVGRNWGNANDQRLSRVRRAIKPTGTLETTTGKSMFFPTLYLKNQSDGLSDNDGMVGFSSGMGFYLGTNTPEYFSHDKIWSVDGSTTRGSWYRFYEGPWEWFHHGAIKYRKETAQWLRDNIIVRAGPYVGTAQISSWSPEISITVKANRVTDVTINSYSGHSGQTNYSFTILKGKNIRLEAPERAGGVFQVFDNWSSISEDGSEEVLSTDRLLDITATKNKILIANYTENRPKDPLQGERPQVSPGMQPQYAEPKIQLNSDPEIKKPDTLDLKPPKENPVIQPQLRPRVPPG